MDELRIFVVHSGVSDYVTKEAVIINQGMGG
jgi:hypothetical protein